MSEPSRFETLRFTLDHLVECYDQFDTLSDKDCMVLSLIRTLCSSWDDDLRRKATQQFAVALGNCEECGAHPEDQSRDWERPRRRAAADE